MQALPYLQLREPESAASSEKKSYRLSLHEVSPKSAAQHKDGQSRSGRHVNRTVSGEVFCKYWKYLLIKK